MAPTYVIGSTFTDYDTESLSVVAASPFGPQATSLVQTLDGETWYLSATGERPAGELHHIANGQDRVVIDGVTSFAVSTNGAVAYTRGTDGGLKSTVLVREPNGTDAVWWSKIGTYRIVSWVGGRLLVEEQQPEGQPPTIVRLDAPGERVELARRAAVSAVGAEDVLLSAMTEMGTPVAMLVDVATAKTVASVDLGAIETHAALGFATINDDGSVIASVLTGDGGWVLAKLEADGSSLTPVATIALPADLPTGLYDLSISSELVFGLAQLAVIPDTSGEVPDDAVTTKLITCSFSNGSCDTAGFRAGHYQVDKVEEIGN
ncbi:MAG: hypothetical protein WAS51_08045 [Ilumatobacteraceae bacterium]